MDRRRAWEKRKREAGMCQACGMVEIYETSTRYCVLCLQKNLDREERRQQRCIQAGVCCWCGQEKGDGSTRRHCGECAQKNRDRVARWRRAQTGKQT